MRNSVYCDGEARMNFYIGNIGAKGLSESMIMVSVSCKNKA